ncbi:MAG: hypothetical protein K9L78_02105 [Victivallales bacterium]|nr:hypothetical protein [Victivallales bacterium]MCF7888888.1 hypothetical protein [Victivallales bacterium]
MLKYIFTLGPSSETDTVISKLLKTADAFRLNSSHLTGNQLNRWLEKLDRIFKKNRRAIPVVIDLQGNKMRMGFYPETNKLPKKIKLELADRSVKPEFVPVPHHEFFETVKADYIITLNDARVKIKIDNVNKNTATATVLKNGRLSTGKGINIDKHPIKLTNISYQDEKIINCSMKFSFTCFAYSFLLDGSEADFLKTLTGKRKLTAKVERPETFEHLRNIDDKFDEIWLCRGDLGAQAGLYNLGKLQKQFADNIPKLKCDCTLAGQVLEHMTEFSFPTRSEIVHLFNIEQNGFKGIVMSDETAIGNNPLAVSDFLDNLRIANS